MANIITRQEVEQQFGYLVLEFDFFFGNTFVFSGRDNLGHWVSMYVQESNMNFVGAKASTLVDDALRLAPQAVRFLIFNKELQIIYED